MDRVPLADWLQEFAATSTAKEGEEGEGVEDSNKRTEAGLANTNIIGNHLCSQVRLERATGLRCRL